MSDNAAQPNGTPEPNDPWAPPERKTPPAQPPAGYGAPVPPVHDQPTVASMPGVGTDATPPPPPGPGQAVPGSYGYPSYPAPNAGAPYGGQPGYGYTAPGTVPGYPGYAGGWPGMGAAPQNGFGITALVLGIVSVVLFCLYGFQIILGILAVIFGVLGRNRAKRGEATNGGMALAGIILGALGILVSTVIIGFIVWVATHADDFEGDTYDDPFATSLSVDAAQPSAAVVR
ncbi:DUF4190 domain-containing protein [Streptomyces sannanensis]|uniref:DUF4190 domain-containing protein n=1 Tax=Streptomyces sannanensis TaxID=285536 RepID=A0ABP6SGN4_9ACTN